MATNFPRSLTLKKLPQSGRDDGHLAPLIIPALPSFE
jgi:hypothetical protein